MARHQLSAMHQSPADPHCSGTVAHQPPSGTCRLLLNVLHIHIFGVHKTKPSLVHIVVRVSLDHKITTHIIFRVSLYRNITMRAHNHAINEESQHNNETPWQRRGGRDNHNDNNDNNNAIDTHNHN